MGCLYVFGIPLFEDKECADKRRNDKTDRKEIEEASDVAKQEVRQEEKSDRTSSRNEQQALSSYFRNYGMGQGDAADFADSYFGAVGDVATAAAPGILAAATGGGSTVGGLLAGVTGGVSGLLTPQPGQSTILGVPSETAIVLGLLVAGGIALTRS